MNVHPRTVFALLLASALPVLAQTKPAPKVPGGFTFSGVNSVARSNGFRLEGTPAEPAHVSSPELDVKAQVIAFDLKDNVLTQVRAENSVTLKLDLPSRVGGQPAHIETKCSKAVLTPKPFKLVLTGNLDGFYQIAGGAKSTIAGKVATFTQVDKNLVADLTGGVTLNIPAEVTGKPDAIGNLTLTAQQMHINQGDGSATLTGNAHAVSVGTNPFDVTANEFTLTRAADGTISTLTTSGRTLVKLDLPPDPAPANDAPAPVAAPAADGTTPKKKTDLGKPTHLEVSSDGAVIERSTSTATFTGNVKGFYILAPAGGAGQPYNFAGSKAVIKYVPPVPGAAAGNALSGLSVQVLGAPSAPVTIQGPPLDFGF